MAESLKDLREKLVYRSPHVWDKLSDDEKQAVESFAKNYKDFLSQAKTERECVRLISELLKKRGFEAEGQVRFYRSFHGKSLAAVVTGRKPAYYGVRLIAAHIDSHRLDLKLHPLVEDFEMAYLKTHYYGGIKKYHWVAMPLALHGVVVKGDGRVVEITIGEAPEDPVLPCVTFYHISPARFRGRRSSPRPFRERS